MLSLAKPLFYRTFESATLNHPQVAQVLISPFSVNDPILASCNRSREKLNRLINESVNNPISAINKTKLLFVSSCNVVRITAGRSEQRTHGHGSDRNDVSLEIQILLGRELEAFYI